MTRLERLLKLLGQYHASVEDYDEGEEEDLRPYFNGEREPAQWVTVTVNYTSHGEAKHFFLPTFDNRSDAIARALEFAEDDIFEELPVAVVNLDTGETLEADWTAVPFIPVPRQLEPNWTAQC